MKKKKTLWNSVAILIVAVLIIMAFIPETLQVWFYAAVFGVWAIYAAVRYFFPFLRERKQVKRIRKAEKHRKQEQRDLFSTTSPVFDTLLRHANHRITAFLKSTYPDATWNWCEEYPETIVAVGGKGRIQIFGVDEYNYGEVTFDSNANMKCSLLKIVPMGENGSADNPEKDGGQKKPPQNPVDPQVWFEQQGRDVLEKLIADLNGYGYRSLTIRENGDVTIDQAGKTVTKRQFKSVPEKMYWNRLAGVLERAGVAGEVQDDGIVVTW